jgi:hypothetical protein
MANIRVGVNETGTTARSGINRNSATRSAASSETGPGR